MMLAKMQPRLSPLIGGGCIAFIVGDNANMDR